MTTVVVAAAAAAMTAKFVDRLAMMISIGWMMEEFSCGGVQIHLLTEVRISSIISRSSSCIESSWFDLKCLNP